LSKEVRALQGATAEAQAYSRALHAALQLAGLPTD
jgi:hypothetical protein